MHRLIRRLAESPPGKLVAEYRRLRAKGLSRYYAADLALFYIPLPWRTVLSFAASCAIALVITFFAGRASAAELRVEYTSRRTGITTERAGQMATWMDCVRGAYRIRAQAGAAKRLAVFCDGRRI